MVRFGSWFELDWAGRPNHSMTAYHVVLVGRKLTTYVYAVGWLFDMETIFRICHIEAHFQVLLASRCLAGDTKLWWIAQGDQAIHGGPWADFHARIIARYGPPPDKGANAPYRDPDIYGDMHRRRYLDFVAEWHAYPNESMGHYCRRFREAMLPYIPQELVDPEWRAMQILKDGLPPEVKYFVPAPVIANPEDVYHVDPVDDADIPEPLFEGFPAVPEDPILAIPLQKIPPHEAEAGPDDDMDPDDVPVNPEEDPDDPLVILIESDDDEQEIWEEFEDMEDEEIGDLEEQEEDPEEIPFDDEDWDVFSDVTTE
ncbi:hypothetical protein TIFTF001_041824 [Ficus carica]|uniref:Uncharacterized protein n=1 Tax=Ficus carica TaxID=3494 RepID=A0AA88CV51_FICCA|nr:hypothetical protein TIFTF001_041824 [Ficus carica]